MTKEAIINALPGFVPGRAVVLRLCDGRGTEISGVIDIDGDPETASYTRYYFIHDDMAPEHDGTRNDALCKKHNMRRSWVLYPADWKFVRWLDDVAPIGAEGLVLLL